MGSDLSCWLRPFWALCVLEQKQQARGGWGPQVDPVGWAEPPEGTPGGLDERSVPDKTDQDGGTSIRLGLDVPQFHEDGHVPILIFAV